MSALLTKQYKNDVLGVLSCFDQVVITGTLPSVRFTSGMTSDLYAKNKKLLDYAKVFAEPMRDLIRENAQMIARNHQIEIESLPCACSFRCRFLQVSTAD
jgi:hypothetical protein